MRRLLATVLALAIAGCAGDPRTPAESRAFARIDGFAGDRTWTQDAAGDHITFSYDDGGGIALGIRPCGRDGALMRKEVDQDWSGASALRLDVHAPERPGTIALAVRAGPDERYIAFKPVRLEPGWNRGVVLPVDVAGLESAADADAWAAGRSRVSRIVFKIIAPAPGTWILSDLASDGPEMLREPWAEPGTLGGPRRMPIGSVLELAAPVVQADARLRPARRGLADAVEAELRGSDPRGRPVVMPARIEDGRIIARLRPDQPGDWSLRLGVRSGPGWRYTDPCVVSVDGAAQPPWGGWQVDPDDARRFCHASGAPFWPAGQNLAWAGDYEPWFTGLAAAGGTWARIWHCPWNNPIGQGGSFAVVDRASVAATDRMFALAAQHRIAVQYVLLYHGWLGSDWQRNPFNAANGGPIREPRDFWTDARARGLMKQLIDYAIARWSAEPALFAWELVNEYDLCPRWRDEDLADWHREMSEHIAKRDPHRTMVTTSAAQLGHEAIWRLPTIAFCQPHGYTPDAERWIDRAMRWTGGLGKPTFLGELGRGWRPDSDQGDREGRHLRLAWWLAAVRGDAGAPAPWWWDTAITPNGLEQACTGPIAFAMANPGRSWHPRFVDAAGTPRLMAAVTPDRIHALLWDPVLVSEPGAPLGTAAVPAGHPVVLTGAAPGTWRVRWWDMLGSTAGEPSTVVVGADDTLRVATPAARLGVALEARRMPALMRD